MRRDHHDILRLELQKLGDTVVRLGHHLVLADALAAEDRVPRESIGRGRVYDEPV